MSTEETNLNSTGIIASDYDGGGLDGECPEGGTNLKLYMCELCDSKACALESLREHYMQKHVYIKKTLRSRQPIAVWSKKIHACPQCDYSSNVIGHVNRHILIHTGETPFKCSHCDFKCRNKTTLRRHIDRHSLIKPINAKYSFTEAKEYQCKKCEFNTSFKGALSRHLLRHEDPKICQHCSARFWKKESYENHVLLHVGVVLHPCKSCDYKTNIAGDLRNHVKRMHSENKSWVCSECNYATRSPSDLSKHKIIHKSDRPYACEWCEYTCKRRSHLTVHHATHNNTRKNYSCPFCDYKAILISTLRIHVRSHTGERPFKCNDCGLTFPSLGGVKSHAYTHIKNWTQSCPHCNFTASKPQLFRKHMQIHKKTPATLSTKTSNTKSLSKSKETQTSKKQKIQRRNATVKFNLESNKTDKSSKNPPSSSPSLTSSNSPAYLNDCNPDSDDFLIKSEPESLAPTLLELDERKIENVEIFYPVKQE